MHEDERQLVEKSLKAQDSLAADIAQANASSKKEGWQFGPNALAEISTLIEALSNQPVLNSGTAQNIESAGALLRSYLLAKVALPDEFDSSEVPSVGLTSRSSCDCLIDEVRTKTFLLAIQDAIKKLSARSQTIEMIDAGCGAVPILGIYAALCSDKVNVTCIESNSNSAHLAERIIKKFGLTDRVEVVIDDAAKYVPSVEPNLLVSETIDAGLSNEPLVQIMTNLVPYCAKNAIVLPSEVSLKAGIVGPIMHSPGMSSDMMLFLISKLFDVAWCDMLSYEPGQDISNIRLDAQLLDLNPGMYAVVIGTEVMCGERTLRSKDSPITYNRAVQRNDDPGKPLLFEAQTDSSSTIIIEYQPGSAIAGHIE